MTSIESTIDSNLPETGISPRKLEDFVRPVVDALTEREYHLSDVITDSVVQHFGVSADAVRVALEDIGMAVRPAPEPEPVVEPKPFEDSGVDLLTTDDGEGKGKNKDRIAALEGQMSKLVEVVEGLTSLAQRLGARA